jgi:sialate O-acetylesterase
MELPLRSTVSALTHTAAAAGLNAVRQFRVGHSVSTTPEDRVDGTWKTCSPEVAGEFGAIGFYFARELHMRTGMPVGIIQAAWAESRLESWLSPAALASEPAFSTVNEQWLAGMAEYPRKQAEYTASLAAWNQEFAAAKSKNQKFNKPAPTAPWGPGHAATPSGAYHGMIHPLTPYALRGILWQPGSNVSYPGHYERETGALISYWRQHFGQADLPFFWIQLPAVHNGEAQGTEWALIRDAQTAALVYPLTGQVVTIDFDETYDSFARNAREVARRLMLLARARVYGAQLDYSGPLFASAAPEGASMRVRFTHGSNALISRDKPLQSFQLAGPDKRFVPATARIERDTVVVTAPGVLQPAAVRYAWMNDPEANLFNGAGLPAAPFRSDGEKRMENGE